MNTPKHPQSAAEPAGPAVSISPEAGDKPRNLGGRPRRIRAPVRSPGQQLPSIVRKMRAETGTGLPLLQKLVRDHPGDAPAQLNAFFRQFRIPAATGRKRSVSFKTEERYYMVLGCALETLRDLNMRVQNLNELSSRHVRHVTLAWERDGRSPSYLATLNTAFRRLGIWMGKPDLAPLLRDLVENPRSAARHTSSTKAKTWESEGVNPEEVFRAMEGECPVTAMHLRLGWAFGLRVEEQLMFRPVEAHKGDMLYIGHGTKGGKLRHVKLICDWEFELIERAKAMASGDPERNPRQILTAGRKTLRAAKGHYYYLCDKIGLSKAGRFGTTAHGARHSFACRRYQSRSGLPAPVLGGSMPTKEMDTVVRYEVSQELGHNRKSASTAYIGTVYSMTKAAKAETYRLMDRDQRLGSDPVMLALAAQARLTTFCLVGPAATGAKLTGNTVACIFCEAHEPISGALMKNILTRSQELLGVPCLPTDRAAGGLTSMDTFEVLALSRARMNGRRPG